MEKHFVDSKQVATNCANEYSAIIPPIYQNITAAPASNGISISIIYSRKSSNTAIIVIYTVKMLHYKSFKIY